MMKKTAPTSLVLSDPQRTVLPVVQTQCRAIFDHRDEVIGVLEIEAADEFRRQATAIETFVGNRTGRDDARRAARVLECAVGAALGTAHRGQPKKNLSRERDKLIDEKDRHRFRLIHLQHGKSDAAWRLCPSCTALVVAVLAPLADMMLDVKHRDHQEEGS